MKAFGKQKADDVEVFVMVSGQPARVGERIAAAPETVHSRLVADVLGGKQHARNYGRIAVLRCPLWLSSGACITSGRRMRGSSRPTKEAGRDIAAGNVVKRLLHQFRRVMEIRLARDPRNSGADWCRARPLVSAGRPPKRLDGPALGEHRNGPMPSFGLTDRFDDDFRRRGRRSGREPPPPRWAFLRVNDDLVRTEGRARGSVLHAAASSTAITLAPATLAMRTNMLPMGPMPMITDRIARRGVA